VAEKHWIKTPLQQLQPLHLKSDDKDIATTQYNTNINRNKNTKTNLTTTKQNFKRIKCGISVLQQENDCRTTTRKNLRIRIRIATTF